MYKTRKRRTRPSSNSNRRRGSQKKRTGSEINPQDLVRKATPKIEEKFEPAWKYEATNLHKLLKRNIAKRGYVAPTPIQEQVLPHAFDGKDILGIAGTGTGKTAAFLIPIIGRLLIQPNTLDTLIVVPTRELAMQVMEEFRALALDTNLFASCFIGGTSVRNDIKRLKMKNHLVVGTPGRLLDLVNQKALKLHPFSTLVLDEFDRMLDMGFITDVNKIVGGMSNRKQTLFFSATFDKKQKKLTEDLLTNPIEVKISQGTNASERVNQDVLRSENGKSKMETLVDLINGDDFSKVLIFAETKRVVDKIDQQLGRSGFRSDVIHGDKTQGYRTKALKKFSDGKTKILVATDVAARGLDIDNVSHVINYQLPKTMDSYIHRIGRTGRAGKTGQAYTFID